MLKENQKAINFNLKGSDGKMYSLDSFKNHKLIIYFYPKDNTPGCTIQATDFSKYKEDFEKIGFKIIGISLDSYETHCKFINKKNIEIILLSDTDAKISEKYDVLKKGKIKRIKRSTFILDENHNLLKIEYGVKSIGHAKLLLENLNKIKV